MIKAIKNSLKELGFTSKEVKVYVALTQLGEATATQVAKKIELPRTTVIGILNKLKDGNYLTTNKYRGTTYYWIESPKTLVSVLEQKLDIAGNLSHLLTDLYRAESHFPYAHIYDTKAGIRKFIEKTLANTERKSVIYTIDTPEEGNYAKIYSDNIQHIIFAQKQKREIITHTLIPYKTFKLIEKHKLERQEIKIREMPKGIDFKSSLWIIKNMLVHFSGKPPFVTAIRHNVIVSSIKSIYNFLWNMSEEKY
jgi:sugar-specific transcriptional regulator TrmB